MNRAEARATPRADEHEEGSAGFADTMPYFHDTMPFSYVAGDPELEAWLAETAAPLPAPAQAQAQAKPPAPAPVPVPALSQARASAPASDSVRRDPAASRSTAAKPSRDAAGAGKSPMAAPRGLSTLARLRPIVAFAAIAVASFAVASALVLRADRLGASPVFPQAGRSPHAGAVESQAAASPALHPGAEVPAR